MKQTISWTFPTPATFFFRIELFFVTVIAALIFFGTFFYYDFQVMYAIVYTVLFLILYTVASYWIRSARQAESSFQVQKSHLQIVHRTKNHTQKEKVPLHHIARHKLDKLFLGGYVLTHKGKKHQLFFNTKKEVVHFEQFLRKHLS